MSQSPLKKDVTVKAEPESKPLSQKPTSTPTSKPANDSGWQDIPLKSCTKEEVNDIRFHIMKFQATKDIDIVEDFVKPVRLHRKDPRNIQFQLSRQEIDRRKKEQEQIKLEQEREGITPQTLTAEEQEAIDNGEDPSKFRKLPEMSSVAPDGRRSKKNAFKRKTRQINLMDDAKRKLRYEEYYPWVIEDYEGKNVFVGNYEAGSSDTQHVLFVFDKDGFKMVPAEKVYKFTPRNRYATLTLEEAEAKMEKNSSVPRWLMKHMEESNSDSTTDSRFRNSAANGNVIHSSHNNPANGRRTLRTVLGGNSTQERDSDHDDLDFEEDFADDEEAPIMDGDEEENKFSEQKIKKEMLKAAHFEGQADVEQDEDLDDLFETEKSRKVDKEGKKLRKVLNKTEGGVYDSEDDDNLNPYLSKSDLESNDESDEEAPNPVKTEPNEDGSIPQESSSGSKRRAITAQSVGDGFVVVKAPSEFLSGFPRGEWIANGRKRPSSTAVSPRKKAKTDDKTPKVKTEVDRSKSLSPSPAAPTSNVDLNSSGPDGVLVTIREVLDMVKNNPLTTKELLLSLKSRVNAHRDNKQRIISIVKQNLKLVDGRLVLKE